MSSADSCLNSGAVLIVNDIIRPINPKRDDKKLVKDAKVLTVVIGVISSVCAIYANSIVTMFARAYSMAGAGIVPLLLIGLFWKKRNYEKISVSKRNSKVTPWGARSGIIVGAVCSQIPFFGESATLVGILASGVVIVVVSLITKNVKCNDKFVSQGYVE